MLIVALVLVGVGVRSAQVAFECLREGALDHVGIGVTLMLFAFLFAGLFAWGAA